MNAATFQTWLAMGGHAGFVWGSVGVVLLGLLAERLALAWQRRQLLRQLQQLQQAQDEADEQQAAHAAWAALAAEAHEGQP